MLKLIVATERHYGIGYKNQLPWAGKHLEDLKYFKEQTLNHTVVMGYNTFKSLKRPEGLPKRKNIVITSKPIADTDNVLYMSYSAFLAYKEEHDQDQDIIWVMGGSQLYRALITECEELHISRIDKRYPCDTHFDGCREFEKQFIMDDTITLSDDVEVHVYRKQ